MNMKLIAIGLTTLFMSSWADAAQNAGPCDFIVHQSGVPTEYSIQDIEIEGTTLYAANDNSGTKSAGFIVYDISMPNSPKEIGSYMQSYTPLTIKAKDQILYVGTNGCNGLHIYDASDPFELQLLSVLIDERLAVIRDVEIFQNYAFISSNSQGVVVVDITDSSNPFVTSQYNFDVPYELAYDSVAAGDYLYVTGGGVEFSTMKVLNISDPNNLVFVSELGNTGHGNNISIRGSLLYVGGSFGLEVVDVSDPTNLVVVDSYSVPGFASWIFDSVWHENLLITATWFTGSQVLDLSDPNSIQLAYSLPFSFETRSVSTNNGYLYLSRGLPDGKLRLEVFKFIDCDVNFSCSQSINFLDVSSFLKSFQQQLPSSDLNNDGHFNFLDISMFISAYGAGC